MMMQNIGLLPRHARVQTQFILSSLHAHKRSYQEDFKKTFATRKTSKRPPQAAACKTILLDFCYVHTKEATNKIKLTPLQLREDARQPIADYSSPMRVLGDHPAINSTSPCVIDMSSTTSTTQWHIDDNSQHGQSLLVID